MDLFSYLVDSASTSPKSPIWVDTEDETRSLTWDQHVVYAKSIAVGLRARGIKESSCVAIVCRNDIWYPVLACGIIATGAIYAGVYDKFTPLEITRSLNTIAAEWVFVGPEDTERVSRAAVEAGIPASHVFSMDMLQEPTLRIDSSSSKPPEQRTLSEILRADASLWRPPFRGKHASEIASQPCIRTLTSGTTSSPKAAELTHGNCRSRANPNVSIASGNMPTALHGLAMSHQSGTIALWETLLGNQATYLSQEVNAQGTIALVQRYGITNMTTHPRHIEDITAAMSDHKIPRDALRSLRQVNIAGGPISSSAMQNFRALLQDASYGRAVYGSTEAGTLSVNGMPPGNVSITIRDPESGEHLGSDRDGEICASGPGVFRRYANNEVATKSSFFIDDGGRGWHRTGDRGHFSSENGLLTVTGRYKEAFKVSVGGGYDEVAPEEVEAELLNHEAVDDVAVTHVDGRMQLGDLEPAAYIVLKQGKDVSAQEMVDYVARRLSGFKAPTGGVFFVRDLPRIGFGKVARRRLVLLQAKGNCSESSRRFLSLAQ